MIIEQINIINFGKLQNFTLDLSEGINIIEGSNESGKSTISAFIKFMFYGLAPEAHERARSISWQSSTAAGTLTLRDGESLSRIEREAVPAKSQSENKVTMRERCVVIDTATGKPLYKGKVPGEVFFGIPRNVFESTAFIGQLDGTQAGGKTLAEATENILFSADETVNTKKAVKKLDEARVQLYHKNRKGGKIFEYSAERAELEEKLEEAQKVSADIISIEGTIRACRETKEKSELSLSKVRAELTAHERFIIQQNFKRLDEEDEKIANADSVLKSLNIENRYGEGMTDERFAAKLAEEKMRLITLETKLQMAQNAQQEAQKELNAISEPLSFYPPYSSTEELLETEATGLRKNQSFKAAACVFSALTALCALLIFVNPFIAIAACAVMLAAACTFWVMFASGSKKLREECYSAFQCSDSFEFRETVERIAKTEIAIDFAEKALEEASERTVQIRAQYESVKSAIKSMLTGARFAVSGNIISDIDDALEEARFAFEARKSALRDKAEAEAKLSEITEFLENVPEDEKEKALETSFDEEAMLAFDPRARKRDGDFLAGSIAAQTEKIHALECELAALAAKGSRPAEIAQEISVLDSKIAEANEKFKAYVAAIEAITSASGKLRDGVSPKIASGASELMQGLSGGKYSSVFVDSEFGMTYSAGGITRDASTLSAGTSDIAYISLRLSLAETLCKTKIPPFVFDESFARMDDERLTAALKLIEKKFGFGSQAIIFTCHGRESSLAKNTVKSTSLSI
jgi:uncharacterized protein YhaN